ncbi:hypothetical protein [Streptomyces hirsutus]|uniref:hypothetical protein n=1 Tax=Streptomyces hirsutus TaxID=35620 RepID=UPI0036B80D4C
MSGQREGRTVKPVKTFKQEIEVFEVYSPKLGRTVPVALKHNPDDMIPANLLSDGGLVMLTASVEADPESTE